jgi:hypothetical protein
MFKVFALEMFLTLGILVNFFYVRREVFISRYRRVFPRTVTETSSMSGGDEASSLIRKPTYVRGESSV